MARARLEIFYGDNFSESQVLTWKRDGLIVFPTSGPRRSLARISSYGAGTFGHLPLGDTPSHLLWFTVYDTDDTSFLDAFSRGRDEEFLIGDLIYITRSVIHHFGRDVIQRYYVLLMAVGRSDD